MPNRLALEASPYLLQHAENPVDWYPWGEEAFEAARREDKPIFLSVGYSTCHWCHVMERESFENERIAALLNAAFICVKVDREERPDVDDVYMTACNMLTGAGGWPLTVLLDHDKRPFFAATYLPPSSRMGRVGLDELVPRVDEMWRAQRDKIMEAAESVTDHLLRLDRLPPPQSAESDAALLNASSLAAALLDAAQADLAGRFDAVHGGFGPAPKFPAPHNLLFLLRRWRRTGDPEPLRMVESTLRAMRAGGVFDHVGLGFHRYSTDARWLVPHFEKMLYDQALLAMTYLEAYQATRRDEYAAAARDIFSYVLRDLSGPRGVFLTAEDADSEGVEGRFYVWTAEEIRALLSPEDAALYLDVYGFEENGNYEEEAAGGRNGTNIPHLAEPLETTAARLGMEPDALRRRLETIRGALFQARGKRVRPHLDDKILTDLNGLMIAALAYGSRVLGAGEYLEAAVRALSFVLRNLRGEDGRLRHAYRPAGGGPMPPGTLDDHAFLLWGLLEVYRTGYDPSRLKQALDLSREMLAHFRDDRSGALFFTAHDAERLPVRRLDAYDAAVPSGNSVAAHCLLRLARMIHAPDLESTAHDILRAFSAKMKQLPAGFTHLLSALDQAVGSGATVVVNGFRTDGATRAFLHALDGRYLPETEVMLRPLDDPEPLDDLTEYTRGQGLLDGRSAAYVCRDFACARPVNTPEEMLELLEE